MIREQAPPGHMLTHTGKFFDPLNPDPDLICLEDIAHALANICRYNGHVNFHYSVAQHSYLVALQFKRQTVLRKQAILHDAPEAYLGDLIAPLKYLDDFAFYLEAEDKLGKVIASKYKLKTIEPDAVMDIDKKLRGSEMLYLKDYYPEESNNGLHIPILELTPKEAKRKFWRILLEEGLHD